jgi:hypothetical protein
VGDADGDGRLDVFVSDLNAGQFALLAGHGNGSFGSGRNYPAGPYPNSLATGDFNGDGHADLACVNTGGSANSVSVLLGSGIGTFGPAVAWGTGYWPFAVAVGDLNLDGLPDLVVTNDGGGSVSVLDGQGNGGFATHRDYGANENPVGLAVGDVNGDGRPDVVVTNINANMVTVLAGNGHGALGEQGNHYCGVAPTSVAIGQVDSATPPDLIVANDQSGFTLALLRGTGAGGFGAANFYGTGGYAFGLAVADLNGDGKLDYVAPDYAGGFVSVVLGDGLGGFGTRTDYAVNSQCHSVAIGDLDGDGHLDLVAANGGARTVTFLPGVGDGTFGPRQDYGTGEQPIDLVLVDVNGDGRLDVVTANASGADISVLENTIGLTAVIPQPPAGTLRVGRARPNPTAGAVELTFSLPRAAEVTLAVFDVAGRRVRATSAGRLEAGLRTLRWDARDAAGAPVRAGLYLCELRAGEERAIWRVAVTR